MDVLCLQNVLYTWFHDHIRVDRELSESLENIRRQLRITDIDEFSK